MKKRGLPPWAKCLLAKIKKESRGILSSFKRPFKRNRILNLSPVFMYDKLDDSAKVVSGGGQGGNSFDCFARDRGDCVDSGSTASVRQKCRSFRRHCRRGGTAFW